MNKQYLIASLLLLLVPACGKKKSQVLVAPVAPVTPVVPLTAVDQTIPGSEDLDAFVLEESENPFNSHMASLAEEPNKAAFATVGDKYSDSAQYGLKTLYYDFDKYTIRPDQKAAFTQDAEIIKSLISKGYSITLEGHACDSAGSSEYNLMLSEKRAEEVKNALKKAGIDVSHIHTVGRGSEKLIVPSGNKEQQAPNRRVEFYAYQPQA